VSLTTRTIPVRGKGTALVKLTCLGHASCHGTLRLAAKRTTGLGARKASRALPIGTVGFSIAGAENATVKVKLTRAGRGLLGGDHGRLAALLRILKLEPPPRTEQVKAVELVRQKTRRQKSHAKK
jgi:hypothetical protein